MERNVTHFEEQLGEISEKVLRLGGLAEEAIGRSVQALINRDSAQAREVILGDAEVDRLELEIDHLCLETLARHQPMAADLRFLTTAMKITPDLERSADHAVNISERTIEFHVNSVFNKTGANSRMEAVTISLRNNWISLEYPR